MTPGDIGSDGGCDGSGEIKGKRIYFQSHLERERLDASRAAKFYGNLGLHQAQIGVLIAGAGYTAGFAQRLLKDPQLHQRYQLHLLSLRDIFEETEPFHNAVLDLPPLRNLSQVAVQ